MGMDPTAQVFYGIKLDYGQLPERIKEIHELVDDYDPKRLISYYLLENLSHTPEDPDADHVWDLTEETGLKVVESDDEYFLTLKSAHFNQYGHGFRAIPLRVPQWPDLKFLTDNAEKVGGAGTKPSWYVTADFG